MKTLLNTVLALLAVSGPVPACEPQVPPGVQSPYVERDQRQISFYPGGKIDLTAGLPGSVEILGWEKASLAMESEKIVYYLPADQAKALAADYPLRFRHTQTTVTISSPPAPRESSAQIEINIKLFVPRDKTDIKIKIAKGDLRVGKINGWIEANLEQGSVEADSMLGYFSAVTKEGDLSVKLSGKRWLGHGFTAATQRGSVDLRLPVPFSAALQLDTRKGDLTVDYPEQMVDGEKVPLLAVVKDNACSLTASVGDGGAPIRIHTDAGDIHLTREQTP